MNLGDFIKQKRLERNLNLEQLGKRVGVSKMTIQRWESGEIKNIKSDKIESLARALGVPVVALFNGFDENGNSKGAVKEVSSKEFADEVKALLNKTTDLTEQQKQYLLTTLDIICNKK
jgi:repressor LexA